MKVRSFIFTVVFIYPLLAAADETSINLAINGGLEAIGANNIPAHWRCFTPWGGKATFTPDNSEKHSGERSFKIHAENKYTQSWLMTDPIPVAPGEMMHVSAWVNVKDIRFDPASDQIPTVQIMAAFINSDGHSDQFASPAILASLKTNPENKQPVNSDWTKIEGDLKVPPLAARLYMRFGMYNATGTAWFDDINIAPQRTLVCRADLKTQRYSPDSGTIPIIVINRDKEDRTVHVKVQVGPQSSSVDLKLSGEITQTVSVPIEVGKRGNVDCTSSILDADNQVIFSESRKLKNPPPMQVGPPIPTHWAKEDGAAKITGDIDLALSKKQRENANLEVRVIDNSGKQVADWTNDQKLVDGWNHWQLTASSDLPVGDYKIAVELKPKAGDAIAGEQHWSIIWRKDSQTTLSRSGYLVANHQPIFPLGIFNGNAHLKELAENGFTIAHAYNASDVTLTDPPNDLGAQEFFDETQKAGLKAVFLVPREFVFAHRWDQIRRRVQMFRNHPALLAWDEEEGIARGDMSLDDLKMLRKIIADEDPNHPLMVGDSHAQIDEVKDRSEFFPVDQMDLGMWWWYPLPPGGPKADALEGVELSAAKELAPPTFLTRAKTDKPIWVGVQSYKKPQPWARYPTETEYRAQAYIAIIHGAKGLMWYGGSVEDGVYIDLKAGHWDYLKRLGKELHEMSPIFMAETIESPKFEPQSAPISLMLKNLDGRQVLLTANRGASPATVTFHLSGDVHSVKALYETRDPLTIELSQLKDRFQPYEVHVYELNPK